jgi:hypothetical protein
VFNLNDKALQITALSSQTRNDEKLLAIAFHYKGDVDINDVSELQKSALYDVRTGAQIMVFHYDDKFAAEFAAGIRNTNYFLFIVPSAFRPDGFSTVRQAFAQGARLAGAGVGPP